MVGRGAFVLNKTFGMATPLDTATVTFWKIMAHKDAHFTRAASAVITEP